MIRAIAIATGLLIFISPSAIGVAAGESGIESYAVYGADRYFTLTWEPGERRGRPIVTGHIFNDYGFIARDVRLRVESLDATGHILAKTTGYVPGVVTPGTHAYFEVPVSVQASAYRVTVLSFEWIQKGKGIF